MTNNWSGSPSGYIPLSKMTRLRSDIGPGGYAQPDAALAYLAMAAEFERAVGVPLKFTEAYRDYATSVQLFVARYNRVARRTGIFWDGSYWMKKPGVAAAGIPGTSFHLEGLATDYAYPLTSWTTPGQAWFRANEARFGFSSAQGVADNEPWHKRYIGSTNTAAGTSGTPIEEDDMAFTDPIKKSDSPVQNTAADFLIYTRQDAGIAANILDGAVPIAKSALPGSNALVDYLIYTREDVAEIKAALVALTATVNGIVNSTANPVQ